jgi:hypothetical protein
MKKRRTPLCIVLPTFFFTVWGCPVGAWFGFQHAANSALSEFARNGDDGGASEGIYGLIVGLPLGGIAGLISGAIIGLLFGLILFGLEKLTRREI